MKPEANPFDVIGSIVGSIVEKAKIEEAAKAAVEKARLEEVAKAEAEKQKTISTVATVASLAATFMVANWVANKLVPDFKPLYQKDEYGIWR